MPQFLAVYTGTAQARAATGWDELPENERSDRQARGVATWGDWMQKHAARIVDAGGPLGTTLRVSADGIADTTNNLAAYVIVEAASHAEAAAMFVDHPHFSIFPGDGVEIMQCLPTPGG